MASRAIEPPALDGLLSAIPSLPMPLLARLTARLIERMDELDGDPDLEHTRDEGEPDFRTHRRYRKNQSGPGCAISDPDYGGDEAGESEHDLC